jgi:DNA-directed RNA polymerase subunit RPC12/RpoP
VLCADYVVVDHTGRKVQSPDVCHGCGRLTMATYLCEEGDTVVACDECGYRDFEFSVSLC